jgi:16S rRNA (guanine527-N7)-methyltransferase
MELMQSNVSRETIASIQYTQETYKDALEDYAEGLLLLNKRVNLISREMGKDELMFHIKHCLWITASERWSESENVTDAGSGGGLPGIVLGITHPDKKITLVDIVEKKVLATKQLIRQLGLKNVTAVHSDIGSYVQNVSHSLLVSKHAFKINDLLSMTNRNEQSKIILLKGEDYESELVSIKEEIRIKAVHIDQYSDDKFYEGKRVLTIDRI